MKFYSVVLILTLLSTSACAPEVEQKERAGLAMLPGHVLRARENFDVEHYFPGPQRDTLLTNMATFIYRRPAEATIETRTNPEFRSYYVRSAQEFEYVYHHMTDEGEHYFYVIRPARNLEGTKRGVGGKFTTNENLELVTFEEIFNTTIMDEHALRKEGLKLFKEMIAEDHVDKYLTEYKLIEWPDHRLSYDKVSREWRYVE